MVLAAIRLVNRIKEGSVQPVAKLSALQKKVSHSVHGLLIVATVAMPLSGAILSVAGGRGLDFFSINLIAPGDKMEGLQSFAHAIHVNAPYVIYAILAVHIIAAIKHHFIDKDSTLTRMLGKRS